MSALVMILLLQVVLPLWSVLWLWRAKDRAPRDLFLTLLLGSVYQGFLYLALPWGFLPYALRYLWPLAFGIAAVRACVRVRAQRRLGKELPKPRLSPAWMGVLTALLGYQALECFLGRFSPPPVLDLTFPLRDGVYVVGHGGSNPKINYHNVHPSQRYALDISGLNAAGLHSWSIGPSALERYAIWSHPLYSPCDGTVSYVVNDLPDHRPPNGDRDNPAGNFVTIETGGIRVFLAHMRRGSVRVRVGDQVRVGDLLGEVGNSGNTTEPHLHIHAVSGGSTHYDGTGVPITFNGRFLVRNDVVSGRK